MSNYSPIPSPSPELVGQWLCSEDYQWEHPLEHTFITITNSRLQNVATQAAQWGADQELEACDEWLVKYGLGLSGLTRFRAARRPKPPSLKEQALEQLRALDQHGALDCNTDKIRRALEQLPDAL